MLYQTLADLIVIIHLLFISFGLLGGLFVLWRRWMMLLHLPCVLWMALIEFNNWLCPLTPLENRFREAGNQAGYSGGFVEHYIIPLIYPDELTREIQIALGVVVIAVNILIYASVYIKSSHKKKWR